MKGGLGTGEDKFHVVNFREDSGEQVTVDESSALAVFVAPKSCTIIDIGFAVTTTIAANASDFWTIQIVNQTGNLDLLSADFDTDSGNSGNGGRALTEDTITDLTDDGAGNIYLQNATLAKGDVLVITATKDSSASDLKNPTVVIRYRP